MKDSRLGDVRLGVDLLERLVDRDGHIGGHDGESEAGEKREERGGVLGER